jgi:glutathione S-transferase/RNA polymerase-associated protein
MVVMGSDARPFPGFWSAAQYQPAADRKTAGSVPLQRMRRCLLSDFSMLHKNGRMGVTNQCNGEPLVSILVYDHPLSPYGQKVKIALIEKGVAFEAKLPVAIGSGSSEAPFQRANPRGEVPALIDGNVAVYDSTVILEYIEDKWPTPKLLPDTPAERARVRLLEDIMDTHFEAITWGLGEVRFFGRGAGVLGEMLYARGQEQIRGWYRWLENQLGDRTWFNGAAFGWGDLCVAPFVNGATGFGVLPEGKLAGWHHQVNQRWSVAQCRKAAEAVSFSSSAISLDSVKQAMDQGLFKREYRDHRLEWMVKTGGLDVVIDGVAKQNVRFMHVFE